MYTKCVYYNCNNTSHDTSMFRFPISDEGRLIVWIRNSGNIYLDSLTTDELGHRHICAVHFSPSCISHGKKRSRLLGPAVHINFETAHDLKSQEDMEIDALPSPETLKVKTPTKFYVKRQHTSPPRLLTDERSSPSSIFQGPFLMSTPTRRQSRKCAFEEPKKRLSRKCLFEANINDSPKTQQLKRSATELLKKNKALHAKVHRLRTKQISTHRENRYRSRASTILAEMQQRKKNDKKKWTKEEKNFCLSLFYKSPSTYKFLRRQGVVLAAPSTIRMWLCKSSCLPGLETQVFTQIKYRFEHATVTEKACVVCFDEMSIMKNLEFSKKHDFIEGFEDIGKNHRTNKLAKYALVFVVRGLYKNWKLPVAYFLSSTNMKADNLQILLKATINKLFENGLIPKAVVCDQMSTNQKLYKNLGASSLNPYFFCNDRKLFAIFDVPHLIKNLRNNLLHNDYIHDGERISFSDIVKTFEIDKNSSKSRTLTKITERHLNPNPFQKMNVRLATQVFSSSVCAAIRTAQRTGQLQSSTAKATADFVQIVNNMFDGLNSKSKCNKNPFKCALSQKSTYVNDAILTGKKVFEKLQKISRKKDDKELLTRPPCFDGVIQTCEAAMQLFQEESTETMLYLVTSKLNQDVIENLFARYRHKSGANRNPSAKILRTIFRSDLVNSLIKLPTTKNCEDENGKFIDAIAMKRPSPVDDTCEVDKVILPTGIQNALPSTSSILPKHTTSVRSDIESRVSNTTLEDCSVTYFAGYLAKCCLSKYNNCQRCTRNLIKSVDLNDATQLFILNKSYSFNKCIKLKMPSESLNKLVNLSLVGFNLHFENIVHQKKLKYQLFNFVLKFVECNDQQLLKISCKEHIHYIIEQMIIVKIFFYCKSKKHNVLENKMNQKLKILKNM